MPIPPAVGTITLDWTIQTAGKLGTGVVRVWTKYALRDTTDHVILAPSEFVGTVVNGTGSVVIPDPNDPDISPRGAPLHVRIDTDVMQDEYDFVIPVGTLPGSTVHLDTLGPAVNPPALVQYALASALLNYLLTAGGTITGPITWAGKPTAGGHLTTKSYVDSLIVSGGELYQPSAAGFAEWTVDPAGVSADFGHPTGWIIMVRFRNRTATSLSELGFAVTSAASGPGAYSGVALYEDGTGVVNRLGQSADAGTQWTSPGPKSVAFTAPVTVTPGAYYRAAILWVGSGNGRIAGAPLAILDSLLNAGTRRSTVLTGQSAFPASVTVSSMTTNNALYWLGMK